MITNLNTNLKLAKGEIIFKKLKASFLTLPFISNGKLYLNSSQPSIIAKLKFYPSGVLDLLNIAPLNKFKMLSYFIRPSEQPIKSFYLDLKGALTKPYIAGSVGLFNNMKLQFAGDVAINQRQLNIENFSINRKFLVKSTIDKLNKDTNFEILPKQGKITVQCAFGKFPDFKIVAKASHLKIKDFDVSINQFLIKGKFAQDSAGQIQGVEMALTTLGLIVDSKPLFDIEASLKLDEDLRYYICQDGR